MVEAIALCRRLEEEKEGQAANLELAGWEQRQHLVSLEERMEGCCSSMETMANKRDNWRGKEDKSPYPLGGLGTAEEWHEAYSNPALHSHTCDPAGTTEIIVLRCFNSLGHGEYAKHSKHPFTLSDESCSAYKLI